MSSVAFFLRATSALLIVHIDPVRAQEAVQRNWPAPTELNKPLLAIQIGSIVGAYVIFVAVLLALLIFVGRRLRRSVQSSNYSLHLEMLKPVRPPVSLDCSPVSPMSHNLPSPRSSGFKSWGSLNKASKPSQPSINGSMVTVDESIVATDRQKAQDEMEMLYAAVMEHDAQKASGIDLPLRDPAHQARSPDSQLTNPFTDRDSHGSDHSLAPLKSPMKGFNSSRLSKLFSTGSRSSPAPSKVNSPVALRKLPISSPMASPAPTTPQAYIPENPPLSPRIYNPGPPPTVPSRLQIESPGTGSPGRFRPTPLNLTPGAAASPSTSLPFREAYPQQSAPATKTTFLERPSKLRTGPVTGMPTPYTPYMPFTPVTPFTPGRTITKRQRKREERENGLHALNEDDLVKGDDDMWG